MDNSTLDASDLATYTADQVAALADVDFSAVEAEGARRQRESEKIFARIAKLAAKAQALRLEGEQIILAARRERDS